MDRTRNPLDMEALKGALRGIRASGSRHGALRAAAVYVLFSSGENGPAVTLIKRSEAVSQHRGEYAFPGGGVEPGDATCHAAALREVQEELGIGAGCVEPWGELQPVTTVSSGFLVIPFTGRLSDGTEMNPASAEVAEVVSMPVVRLVDPSSLRSISRLVAASPQDGGAGELEVKTFQAYAYDGRIIWGATARILSQVAAAVQAQPRAT